MNRSTIPSLVPVALLSLSGCILAPDAADTRPPVHVEALVDLSGSYRLREQAITTLLALVDSLGPGDAIGIRSLSSVSHHEEGLLLHQVLPDPGPEPSRMNISRMASYRELEGRADSVRALIHQRVLEIATIPASRKTDIVGGVVAGTESFEAGPDDSETLLIIFTDGMDNGPNRDAHVALDMSKVDVVFAHFDPSGSVEDRMRLKEMWRDRIGGDWGARSVVFLPPSGTIDIARYRASAPARQENAS